VSEATLYSILLAVLLVSAVGTLLGASRVTAPYGRHLRSGWGPTLRSRTAWLAMESPAVVAFAGVYALGRNRADAAPLVLLSMWQTHYLFRTLIYPLGMPAIGRNMPASIALMGAGFNLFNAYLNARWISRFGTYDAHWLLGPRFLAGASLMGLGFATNVWADGALRGLRGPGETGYKIPHGGLYEWVSCTNYLGEIVEWTGWGIAAWSPAGLLFALYTVANLAPRALAHHAWYRRSFPQYPPRRKALVPFVL
jgi:3-oxo-5-alpha-steroid 4-dehydrogenase 1